MSFLLYREIYRDATSNICNLKYSVPKEIIIVFHNGSNYHYHFSIKELANELEKEVTCLGENTEKYITFSVAIGRHVKRVDKKRNEITKTISYRLQYFDSARFMASSLSNLLIILLEEFIKLNVNMTQ